MSDWVGHCFGCTLVVSCSGWAKRSRCCGSHGFVATVTGQALSLVGDGLVPLTIAFASLQVAGPGALGVVLAANRVPIAVLVLFGGVLGDRWNRRAVMVGADLLRVGTQMVTGLLLITGQAGVVSLVALQALAGEGSRARGPASAPRS